MVLRVCLGLWRVLFVYPCFWGFLGVCFFLVVTSLRPSGLEQFTFVGLSISGRPRIHSCGPICNMQLNVLNDLAEAMKALDEKMESVVCVSLYCSVCFSCFVWLLPIGSVPPCSVPPCPLGWSLGAFWSNQFLLIHSPGIWLYQQRTGGKKAVLAEEVGACSSDGVEGVPDHPRANTSVQERKAPEQHRNMV